MEPAREKSKAETTSIFKGFEAYLSGRRGPRLTLKANQVKGRLDVAQKNKYSNLVESLLRAVRGKEKPHTYPYPLNHCAGAIAHGSRAPAWPYGRGWGLLPERPAGRDPADRHYSAAHGHL
jgi:hypothetical protein